MPLAIAQTMNRFGRHGHAIAALALLWGLLLASPALSEDREARKGDGEQRAPELVFRRIANAWEAGDEETLAGLVHAEGLRVTTGRSTERVSTYSPSQAYYFFRNLFQAHRTLLFEFDMMQAGAAKGPVHGMATWKRRRPDSTKIHDVKLVCVLLKQDGEWRLAEINTIR